MRSPFCLVLLLATLLTTGGATSAQESDFPTAAEVQQLRESAGLRFQPTALTGSGVATSSAQGLQLELTPRGARVRATHERWTLDMALVAWGRRGAMRAAQSGPWSCLDQAAEREHAGLSEWFVHHASGFEHGFTLEERPPHANARDPLVLVLRCTSNDLQARVGLDGVEFRDAAGRAQLSYAGLTTYDGAGAIVPSRLTVHENRLTIEIEDEGRPYPLVVDPLFRNLRQELLAIPGETGDLFGYAVDVDGDWMVVSAPRDDALGTDPDDDTGAVYVFQRTPFPGMGWAFVQKLTPIGSTYAGDPGFVDGGGPVAGDLFGYAVAISMDRSDEERHRIAVGAPRHEVEHIDGANPAGIAFACTPNAPGTNLVDPNCTPNINLPVDPRDCACGAVYVFEYDGASFALVDRLRAQDNASGSVLEDAALSDQFGDALAMTRDTLLVGARFEEDPCVSIPDCPHDIQVCRPCWLGFPAGSTPSANSNNCPDPPVDWGAAYVYVLDENAWQFQAKLRELETPGGTDDRDAFDWFGASVSLGTTTFLSTEYTIAVIGAPGKPRIEQGLRTGSRAGGAYVYHRAGRLGDWSAPTALHELFPAPHELYHNAFDTFGRSVAAFGKRLAVGAPHAKDASGAPGSVTLFEIVNQTGGVLEWRFDQQLYASDASTGDQFGASVSLHEERVLVGAPLYQNSSTAPTHSGGAFLFERSGTQWVETLAVTPSSPDFIESYGFSTAVSGAALLVGAMGHDDANLVDRGRAEAMFDNTGLIRSLCIANLPGTDCDRCPCGNTPGTTTGGCLNSGGRSAELHATGMPLVDPGQSTLEMTVSGANRLTFAMLISSNARAPRNPAAPCYAEEAGLAVLGHNGLRCLAGSETRHGLRSIDVSGNTTLPWGPRETLPGNGFSLGQTSYYQVTYRDGLVGTCSETSTINKTQALAVTPIP